MPHLNSHDGNCLGPSVLGVVPKLFFHHTYILLHILPTRDSCCSLNTFASFFARLFFQLHFFSSLPFWRRGAFVTYGVSCHLPRSTSQSHLVLRFASWRTCESTSMQCPGVFSRGPGSQCWKLQGSDVGLSACGDMIAAVDVWSLRCTPPKASGEGLAAPSREPRGSGNGDVQGGLICHFEKNPSHKGRSISTDWFCWEKSEPESIVLHVFTIKYRDLISCNFFLRPIQWQYFDEHWYSFQGSSKWGVEDKPTMTGWIQVGILCHEGLHIPNIPYTFSSELTTYVRTWQHETSLKLSETCLMLTETKGASLILA